MLRAFSRTSSRLTQPSYFITSRKSVVAALDTYHNQSTESNTVLSQVSRTPEDLNLRLSTCLKYRKPGISLKIFEDARKQRLPFNDQSVSYCVYNLVLSGQFRRAEQLLDDYIVQERVFPPIQAFNYIFAGYARIGDFQNIQNLINKLKERDMPLEESTYRYILHNAEKYYLEKDQQNEKYKKNFAKRKFSMSRATPLRSYTPSYEEFVENTKLNLQGNNNNNNENILNQSEQQQNTSSSPPSDPKSIFSFPDIDDEDMNSIKNKSSSASVGEQQQQQQSFDNLDQTYDPATVHIHHAVSDIFKSHANECKSYRSTIVDFQQKQAVKSHDLGSLSDHVVPDYDVAVIPSESDLPSSTEDEGDGSNTDMDDDGNRAYYGANDSNTDGEDLSASNSSESTYEQLPDSDETDGLTSASDSDNYLSQNDSEYSDGDNIQQSGEEEGESDGANLSEQGEKDDDVQQSDDAQSESDDTDSQDYFSTVSDTSPTDSDLVESSDVDMSDSDSASHATKQLDQNDTPMKASSPTSNKNELKDVSQLEGKDAAELEGEGEGEGEGATEGESGGETEEAAENDAIYDRVLQKSKELEEKARSGEKLTEVDVDSDYLEELHYCYTKNRWFAVIHGFEKDSLLGKYLKENGYDFARELDSSESSDSTSESDDGIKYADTTTDSDAVDQSSDYYSGSGTENEDTAVSDNNSSENETDASENESEAENGSENENENDSAQSENTNSDEYETNDDEEGNSASGRKYQEEFNYYKNKYRVKLIKEANMSKARDIARMTNLLKNPNLVDEFIKNYRTIPTAEYSSSDINTDAESEAKELRTNAEYRRLEACEDGNDYNTMYGIAVHEAPVELDNTVDSSFTETDSDVTDMEAESSDLYSTSDSEGAIINSLRPVETEESDGFIQHSKPTTFRLDSVERRLAAKEKELAANGTTSTTTTPEDLDENSNVDNNNNNNNNNNNDKNNSKEAEFARRSKKAQKKLQALENLLHGELSTDYTDASSDYTSDSSDVDPSNKNSETETDTDTDTQSEVAEEGADSLTKLKVINKIKKRIANRPTDYFEICSEAEDKARSQYIKKSNKNQQQEQEDDGKIHLYLSDSTDCIDELNSEFENTTSDSANENNEKNENENDDDSYYSPDTEETDQTDQEKDFTLKEFMDPYFFYKQETKDLFSLPNHIPKDQVLKVSTNKLKSPLQFSNHDEFSDSENGHEHGESPVTFINDENGAPSTFTISDSLSKKLAQCFPHDSKIQEQTKKIIDDLFEDRNALEMMGVDRSRISEETSDTDIVDEGDIPLEAHFKYPEMTFEDEMEFCSDIDDPDACNITGLMMDNEVDGEKQVSPEEHELPFHRLPENLYETRFKYLDSTKEFISDEFFVENKINQGDGVMIQLNDDFEFSLTYNRNKITGGNGSVLSKMVSGGLTGNSLLYSAIVDGYGRGGDTQALDEAIFEMQKLQIHPDHKGVNKTILSFARTLQIDAMNDIFNYAKSNETPLELETLNGILYANTHHFTSIENINEILSLMKQNGYKTKVEYEGSYLYYKASIERDISFIKNAIQERSTSNPLYLPLNTQTYDFIISGLVKNHSRNNYNEIIEFYNDMISKNISPNERILDSAFFAFYLAHDLNGCVSCLWNLRRFGFKVLSPKRVECIIELLCKNNHLSEAKKLLSFYNDIPYLLAPRNLTFLIREYLKTEKTLSFIDSFDEELQWPSYIAFAMIYGPITRNNQFKSMIHAIENDNHTITDDICVAVMYYLFQKNDLHGAIVSAATINEKYPDLYLRPQFYAYYFALLLKNNSLTVFNVAYFDMIDREIDLYEFAMNARSVLSPSNFQELYENFIRETKIDLHAYADSYVTIQLKNLEEQAKMKRRQQKQLADPDDPNANSENSDDYSDNNSGNDSNGENGSDSADSYGNKQTSRSQWMAKE